MLKINDFLKKGLHIFLWWWHLNDLLDFSYLFWGKNWFLYNFFIILFWNCELNIIRQFIFYFSLFLSILATHIVFWYSESPNFKLTAGHKDLLRGHWIFFSWNFPFVLMLQFLFSYFIHTLRSHCSFFYYFLELSVLN
jgi:hypothetical protein